MCIPFVVEPASSTDILQTKSICMNSARSPPNNKFSHQNSGWKRSGYRGYRIRNLQASVSFNSISADFCTVKFSLAASDRHSPGYGSTWSTGRATNQLGGHGPLKFTSTQNAGLAPSCSLAEQVEAIFCTPIFKLDEMSEARLQPRVGVQHLVHVSWISRHDDDHT